MGDVSGSDFSDIYNGNSFWMSLVFEDNPDDYSTEDYVPTILKFGGDKSTLVYDGVDYDYFGVPFPGAVPYFKDNMPNNEVECYGVAGVKCYYRGNSNGNFEEIAAYGYGYSLVLVDFSAATVTGEFCVYIPS